MSTTGNALPDTSRPLAGMTAGDVMTSDVATTTTTTPVGQAMRLMRSLGVRHLPVIGDGHVVGVVDDRQVALALLTAESATRALEQPVSTAMTHYAPQVGPGETLQRVANLLHTSRCSAVVVIDADDHLLGIVTDVDVVSAVALDLPRPLSVQHSTAAAAGATS